MLGAVTLLSLALALQTAPAEQARVVSRDGEPGTPLFTFERTLTRTDGQTVADVRWLDAAGELAATERVTYVDGTVTRYELDQRQLDERYTMTVSGEDAVFEVDRDGTTSRTRRDWTPDTLTIDELRPFVIRHWARLLAGERVEFDFVALDRSRIVRFRLIHRGPTEHRGEPSVLLRMEASSRVVRWVAPEIDLVFSADGQTMLEIRGPLPVKLRRGDGWEDLDGRLVWVR